MLFLLAVNCVGISLYRACVDIQLMIFQVNSLLILRTKYVTVCFT